MFYFYKITNILYNNLPQSWCYTLARVIGSITCWAAGQERSSVENNLRRLEPFKQDKWQIKIVARKIFQNFNICLADFFRSGKINKNNLQSILQLENKENLDSAFKHGKGVILLSAHFGNWELGGIGLALLGYPVSTVYLPQPDRRLDKLFVSARVRHGEKMLELGADTRNIFSVLANKEIVLVVGDLDMGNSDSGIKVNFLGRETIFPRGPAALAVKTGALIVPGFNVMTGNGEYRLILEKPIIPPTGGDKEDNIRAHTQEFANILEKYIRQYPEQWFIFRRLNSP
ncbi:MAG: lysophospholipid acyltransferase family protein [bacterium]